MTTLYCDAEHCGWSREVPPAEVPSWHNVACPSCGYTPIVSDKDLALWHLILAARDAGAVVLPEVDDEPEGDAVRVTLRTTRNKEPQS